MKSRWGKIALVALLLAAGCGEAVVGGKRALVGQDSATADQPRSDRAGDSARLEAGAPDLCVVLACNWCQGAATRDSRGCVVGFSCANGVDPCLVQPCAPGGPTVCQPRERCGTDGLCWPCGAEVCNGKDDDCDGQVDNGAPCPAGQTCTQGQCAASTCAAGQTMCGGLCVDVQADPQNCGACSTACAAGETCVQGACQK
jgi:hypothetical protein